MNTRLTPLATLVVDDSEMECQLLRAQLNIFATVKVIAVVHEGNKAIAYVRGIHEFSDRVAFPYVDLMLLDFKMPGCDGMQVLESLRYQSDRPRIVLWSSVPEQIDKSLAFELGADLVCAKPGRLQELANIIHSVQEKAGNRKYVSPARITLGREPMHA